MNILLTGGAGYIGSHVSLALLERKHKVTIIDDLSTGNKNLIPVDADFIKCDISDNKTITNLLKNNNYNALLHFAGYIKVEESVKNPKKYFDNNTKKSQILFDTCLKHNLTNIIFSSTAAVYGNSTGNNPVKEESLLNPLNPYGESKIQTENYLLKNKKINSIIFRYFNVAGADPLLRSGLISKEATHLIKIASEVAVGKRKKITIFGTNYSTPDGTAVRDYIHVSDLADIHVRGIEYLTKEKKSQIINCGYGIGYSVKNILETFNKINDKKIIIENGMARKGDSHFLVSDISKLKKLFKWKPKYNDLSFIIKTSIEWEKKLLNGKYA